MTHPPTRRIPHLLAALLLFVLASLARANGVYIPQPAYPALPTIPAQSAIIVHRNNTETLVVESAFQTDSPDVAWILPLPAPPTKLDLGEPGMITAATMALRPDITNDLTSLLRTFIGLLLFLVPIYFIWLFPGNSFIVRAGVYSVVVVLLVAIFLPSLGSASASLTFPAPSVNILSAQRLGDYELTTFAAPSVRSINDFLAANSLQPLPAAAEPIIADYIARHWCFVAARLAHSSKDLAVPRPLIATFPTDTPVFPMKLTALANTTTHVDLTIIADKQAATSGFHTVVADRFLPVEARPTSQYYDYATSAYFRSEQTHLALGSPDVSALMWDRCIVTRLAADLPPSAMTRDIDLSFHDLSPHRDHVFTPRSRLQIASIAGIIATMLFLMITTFYLHSRRLPTALEFKNLLTLAAVLALITLLICFLLPVIPVRAGRQLHRFSVEAQQRSFANAVQVLAHDKLAAATKTPAAIAALPNLLLEEKLITPILATNPFTGRPIRPEASPGNFTLHAVRDKLTLSLYDQNAVETRYALPDPTAPAP